METDLEEGIAAVMGGQFTTSSNMRPMEEF